MWLLTNVTTGNVLIVINEKSKYTVGRVGADLVIADDSSISRTHAFVHITTTEISDRESINGNHVKEMLELEDGGSKYGTFHNDGISKGVGIPKQKRIILAEGDRIRFGVLKNIWTVLNITPRITLSILPADQIIQLKQHVQVLGGCILNDWDDEYTHLTMAEINLSSKLLHAILDRRPIVTCDYWCSVVQAARRGRRSLPKVEAYTPPNPQNFDLKYREERKKLFAKLTFVFLHAHHFKKYAPIVEKAGGKSKHLNVGVQKSFLVRKDVVVIQYVPSTESQSSETINTVEDCLKLHSRRTVPEFEIGLAIIQCSIEKFCNPSYNENDNLASTSKLSESKEPQSSVLASSNFSNIADLLDSNQTEIFIPETVEKSTSSTHLTDKSPAASTASGVEQTDSVTIESQDFQPEENNSSDAAMSSLQVTESAQEVNKRKRTRGKEGNTADNAISQMDSEDDELFNFAAKKAHLEENTNSPVERKNRQQSRSTYSPLDELASTSAAAIAKQTPKSAIKQLPIEINKRPTRRTVIDMSGFLEKSQRVPNAQDAADKSATTDNETSKKASKRARIADIDNSDDDDLFCFGGKSLSNDDTNNAKRARPSNDDGGCDSDEDLFDFGGADADEQSSSKDAIDVERSNEPVATRNKINQIVMPKPKPLPAKVSIADWLDCSLSALSIKAEQCKDEVDAVKKENNDSGVEGDSKEIEPIKGGCVVTVVSTKSILHERDIRSVVDNENEKNDSNKNIKNFKKFTKKFRPQNRRVIRTVSSTVGGPLI
ncbi:PREDICTED: nibrin [Rhagoletis zephyria]|uniref:nibrin n=1 Tax=Rhagoletis zephyria TaxID=28612 RepID=UPI0008118271|nr:PREDICTED: nibrin [Rhagoletis zephyria]